MTLWRCAKRVAASLLFYPLTIFYLAAVAAVAGVARGWFRVDMSIVALTLVAIMLIVSYTHREVATVHALVNSQRDELVARIEQLVHAMHMAGVHVPPPRGQEDTHE